MEKKKQKRHGNAGNDMILKNGINKVFESDFSDSFLLQINY